jgi:hypothetical protein
MSTIKINRVRYAMLSMLVYKHRPMPVVERSKAGNCDRTIAGIAGSNHAEGMHVCFV